MKCFIRSESEVRGVLPAPRGSAPRGSAPWGLFTGPRVVPCGPCSRGAAPRGSSARGLLHVPPTLPCALLAAVLLHGAVLPAPLLPEPCILGTVRRGRVGHDSAARPAGFRHSFPPPARLGRRCERNLLTAHALMMRACSHNNAGM